MFYCKPCGDDAGWPEGIRKSEGSVLPPPKQRNTRPVENLS